MRERRLIALILAAILAFTLLCGCDSHAELSVVGTAPEGYRETMTSLEDCG